MPLGFSHLDDNLRTSDLYVPQNNQAMKIPVRYIFYQWLTLNLLVSFIQVLLPIRSHFPPVQEPGLFLQILQYARRTSREQNPV